MYYKGLFFENEEQLKKASELLAENNIAHTEDNTYNQFFVQEAIESLEGVSDGCCLIDNNDEDLTITNKMAEDLAYDIRKCDSILDSEMVTEITYAWLDKKGYYIG